jgi:hypothetical protein
MRDPRPLRLAAFLAAGLLPVLVLGVTVLGGPAPAEAQTAPVGHDHGGTGDAPSDPRLPPLDPERLPAELLGQARLLLSGIHGAPDRLLLEARLPAAREVLLLVAREPNLLPFQRGQALWALAQWGGDEVLAVYHAVLDEGHPTHVHDALLLLGRVGGDRAVPTLALWLAHEDLQVRLSAIEALGENDSDAAAAALERAEATETSPVARERLIRALQRVR